MKYVRKRDNSLAPFDQNKISTAIDKTIKTVEGENNPFLANELATEVVGLLDFEEAVIDIEEIQDMVEQVLINQNHYAYARAFVLYREQHHQVRKLKSNLGANLIDSYISKLAWRVSENANSPYSAQALNLYISGTISANYWLNKVYPKEIARAHTNGDIHIHDLGTLLPYCCGWDLYNLLEVGFGGVPGQIESGPAKHFRTALGQVVNFMFTLQGECYSEDTQVLTDSGWKYFPDVKKDDFIYTLNPETLRIELQKPVKFFTFPYIQNMYRFTNQKLNLMVTPNHNMVTAQRSLWLEGDRNIEIIESNSFDSNIHIIPNHSVWVGHQQDFFILPAFGKEPELEIPMNDWLVFLGSFLARGTLNEIVFKSSIENSSCTVAILQPKGTATAKFEEFLKKSSFEYTMCELEDLTSFTIFDNRLSAYLKQFEDRFIPNEIRELSRTHLEVLFSWIIKNSGSNDNIRFYTDNTALADNIQEIALKIGQTAVIQTEQYNGQKRYGIEVLKTDYFEFRRDDIIKTPYVGNVYCLEVPNHILYVRRDGKACWCGNSAGAQALSSFDTYLAPFIHADKLTENEVYQCLQEFMFNMNVPTRAGYQVPFTNITQDIIVPSNLASTPALVGGKPYGCYGDFQREMDILNSTLAEVMIEGDHKGRSFTFPIPTINITKDFQWNRPSVQNLFRLAAKYGSQYFANFVSSDMNPDDIRSMCCRLKLDLTELRKKGGGLFGAHPLTGSIGVTTVNLSRLAYQSSNKEEFFKGLEYLIRLGAQSLTIKREIIENMTEKGLYPYARFYLKNVKKARGSYWANHFNTIGVVAGNEACLNLLGLNIGHPDGKEFMVETLRFARELMIKLQHETGFMFNLEATPAEGASYRLAKRDKQDFPDIITANEEAWRNGTEPYYTNSTMLPVNYTDDLFELMAHQSELQPLYTGGTVNHIFLGEANPDPVACANLIKSLCENYPVPYLSLTPTYSACPTHGYLPGKQPICPQCGKTCDIYSRVVGYYRPITCYNPGKQAEFKDRFMFDKTFSSLN